MRNTQTHVDTGIQHHHDGSSVPVIVVKRKESVEVEETIEGKSFRVIEGNTRGDEWVEVYILALAPKKYLHVKKGADDGTWVSVQILTFLPDMDARKRIEPCSKEEAYEAYLDALDRIEIARRREDDDE